MDKQMKPMDIDRIHKLLPPRAAETHKGHYGKIALICGSKGYTGAAYLSAMGALRTGAGVVYLAVPESIYEIEAVKLSEPVVIPMPDQDGMLSKDALHKLLELLPHMNAVLIGCGLGRSPDVTEIVYSVLRNCQCPVVLDADGISAISANTDILRDTHCPVILTPHSGEFQRIYQQISSDRRQDAVAFSQKTGSILLLKGHQTIITNGIETYINPTGNPGMATGGSGDVLAGMIVSLLGQGLPPLEAAAAAAWLHGAAGDICAQEIGQYGMLPQDILNVLPRLLP